MATPAKAQRIKTPAVNAPMSRADAETAIKRIGERQQQIKRIEADLNDKINALKAEAQEQITPLNEEIQGDFQGLHVYAEANRSDLLKGRSKTVKLGAGDMGWRINPPKCQIRGQDAVVEALERQGLSEAVRIRKEVNKEAVINDPDRYRDIKGITIKQTEEFFVKPHETELERVEVVK